MLDADRRRLLAEDELVVRQTETLINLVAVYKALGGPVSAALARSAAAARLCAVTRGIV